MEGSKIPHELKNLEFCFVKKTTSFLVKCLIWAKSQSVQVFGFGGLNMNQFVSFEVPTQLLSEAAFFWKLKKRCFFFASRQLQNLCSKMYEHQGAETI